MASDLDIVNAALLQIGDTKITSFVEGTDKADTCKVLYEQLREKALGMYDWRFATTKIQLSRLVLQPVNEWTYQYDLPTDRVSPPVAVYNSDQVGATPMLKFEIFNNRLLADDEAIWIDYRFRQTEGEWPGYFVYFMQKAMAADLAMPIMENATRANDLFQIAWGPPSDNGLGGQYALAAKIDASGNVGNRIVDFSLVTARF